MVNKIAALFPPPTKLEFLRVFHWTAYALWFPTKPHNYKCWKANCHAIMAVNVMVMEKKQNAALSPSATKLEFLRVFIGCRIAYCPDSLPKPEWATYKRWKVKVNMAVNVMIMERRHRSRTVVPVDFQYRWIILHWTVIVCSYSMARWAKLHWMYRAF